MSEIDPATLKLAIGRALRELRLQRLEGRISLEALAYEIGMDRTFLGALERGRSDPSASTLYRLAEAFHIEPAAFMQLIDSYYQKLRGRQPRSISPFDVEMKRLRELADESPIMMWIADSEQHCVYANRLLLDYMGCTLEEVKQDSWRKFQHPDDSVQRDAKTVRAFARRQPYIDRYRLRKANGEYAWVRQQAVPYVSPKGVYVGYMGSVIEIPDGDLKAQAKIPKKPKALRKR